MFVSKNPEPEFCSGWKTCLRGECLVLEFSLGRTAVFTERRLKAPLIPIVILRASIIYLLWSMMYPPLYPRLRTLVMTKAAKQN